MKFHEEVLAKSQQNALRKLGPSMTSRGFSLGGGTAIAIQLGHRQSVDLDWFTRESFGDGLVLAQDLGESGVRLTVRSTSRGTLHASASRVRVTFLEYLYPLLHDPIAWKEFGCDLLSLDDLACMKLSAVAQRGAKKDFIDLYALGVEHCSLSRMLELYEEKYEVKNTAHILYGLAYFDDADAEPMPRLHWNVTWKNVKESIRQWLRQLD